MWMVLCKKGWNGIKDSLFGVFGRMHVLSYLEVDLVSGYPHLIRH